MVNFLYELSRYKGDSQTFLFPSGKGTSPKQLIQNFELVANRIQDFFCLHMKDLSLQKSCSIQDFVRYVRPDLF